MNKLVIVVSLFLVACAAEPITGREAAEVLYTAMCEHAHRCTGADDLTVKQCALEQVAQFCQGRRCDQAVGVSDGDLSRCADATELWKCSDPSVNTPPCTITLLGLVPQQ